jgi:hypothetical protein
MSLMAPARGVAREAKPERGGSGRPALELRATPSTAFSPATVMVVARLVGGADQEEFYCPGLEWDWGDGSRSAWEGDCPPFDDETKMARLFSVRYRYHGSGAFTVRLTLRRAGRTVATASVPVRILGRGDEEGPDAGPAASVGGSR